MNNLTNEQMLFYNQHMMFGPEALISKLGRKWAVHQCPMLYTTKRAALEQVERQFRHIVALKNEQR